MKTCWANVLGECKGRISGEHIVTKNLWSGDSLSVKGLPWCREGYKFIGKASFTANILCRQHNSDLSPVDDAGTLAFAVFRSANNIHTTRTEMRQRLLFAGRFDDVEYRINGPLLERWLLKTLINSEYAGKQDDPIGANASGAPVQSQLVEIAFGKRSFEGRAGLYLAAFDQEAVHMQEGIQYASCIKDDPGCSYVFASEFIFYGFRFFLCLEPSGFPDSVQVAGRELRLLHRIRTVNLDIEHQPSQRIEFSW
jgi:hypothetical protein